MILLGCALGAGEVGCSSPQEVVVTESGVPLYGEAHLVYQIDNVSNIFHASHLTPNQEDELFPKADPSPHIWSSARLEIEYPHPQGNSEQALVTLYLYDSQSEEKQQEAQPSILQQVKADFERITADTLGRDEELAPREENNSETLAAVRELDIPRHQLDFLIVDLVRQGFFNAQFRPTAEAYIEAKVDRRRSSKRWTSAPRFNDLLMRTYQQGRIVLVD